MGAVWFTIISVMLAVYVVLDGFDFGAGILHLFVAKNDDERRTVLGAIGPVWDGNEVWLLASGGVLVFAFPRAYSTGFSGFYLPLIMVLWLLIIRGISIEFRSHQPHTLWRSFWDGAFALSSTLMAIFLGAALGNVIRGVPIEASGFFSGPLFTNFQPGVNPGVLDWYTVLIGLFTLFCLAGHGALYLIWKTTGPVHDRAKRAAVPIWSVVAILGILATIATNSIKQELYANLISRGWPLALVALMLGSLLGLFVFVRSGKEAAAFICSALFIVGMLAGTAAGAYPVLLHSTINPAFDVTVSNAHTGEHGMQVGLIWWTIALALAVFYFTHLFRSFRGKVVLESDGHGY